MHIINLTPCEPGVYCDPYKSNITAPPEGWAYIPDDFPLPSTFPRLGSLEAEEITYTNQSEAGAEYEFTMMTVTSMTEGTLPEPQPEPEMPTTEERIKALENNKADQTTVDELSEALELLLSGDTGEEVASDEA